jgi:hypothetical protein
MVQLRLAGVGSVLPALSLARTSKLWSVAVSEEYCLGELQGLQAPESMRHSKLEPFSLALKLKLAEVAPVDPEGPESIVVSGGVVSAGGGGGVKVQFRLAGVGSVLPALSLART